MLARALRCASHSTTAPVKSTRLHTPSTSVARKLSLGVIVMVHVEIASFECHTALPITRPRQKFYNARSAKPAAYIVVMVRLASLDGIHHNHNDDQCVTSR